MPKPKEQLNDSEGWYDKRAIPIFQALATLIPENVGVALISEMDNKEPEKASEVKGYITFPSGERLEIRYIGSDSNKKHC